MLFYVYLLQFKTDKPPLYMVVSGQKIEKKRHYMMREGTSISAEVLPVKVFKAVVEILKLFLSKSKTAWLKV